MLAQTVQRLPGAERITIGAAVSVLEDTSGKLSIAEISSAGMQSRFAPSDDVILNFPPFSKSWHWVRIDLGDASLDTLFLEVAQPLLPRVELYTKTAAENWTGMVAGYLTNPDARAVNALTPVFPLPRGGGNVYLRLPPGLVPIPLVLWTAREYKVVADRRILAFGLYMGILLFTLVNNTFLFFSLRNWIYIHYVLIVAGFIGFSAAAEGYSRYLFPGTDPMYLYILIPIFSSPISLSYGLLFLEVKEYIRWWYLLGLGILGYLGLYVIATLLLPFPVVSIVNQVNALITIVTLICFGLATGARGSRLGYWFAGTYLVFLVTAVLEVAYIRTGSPVYLFQTSYISIGILIEVVMLALLLSRRFEWERRSAEEARAGVQAELLKSTRENERIVREQNAQLEDRIAERTVQISEQNQGLERSLNRLKMAQAKLVESEKLASLGQLTAGVAHEINNPVNFISVGVNSLKQNFQDILESLTRYLELDPATTGVEEITALRAHDDRINLAESIDDSNRLFRSIDNGVERTVNIVKSLRNFSRLDEGDRKWVDLHEGIESTLRLLSSNIRQKAEIIKDYGDLPPVNCQAGKINQVILNLLNNAIQAIPSRGTITITTRHHAARGEVEIGIADDGAGISTTNLQHVFEPFFTTKAVGKGTGLGLSISHGIVEENGGKIEVESTVGTGTTFTITLPVDGTALPDRLDNTPQV